MKQQSETIRLRPIEPDDLPLIFEFQVNAESNQMAFTRPRAAEDFAAHWDKILADPSVIVRAIVVDESLVGSISCFESDGQQNVGYWIGKQFWGRGIATQSLILLLEEVPLRPLYSRVAVNNIGSTRVLQKCGFQEVCKEWSPATERYVECEELVMLLPNK